VGLLLARRKNQADSEAVETVTADVRRTHTFDYSKIAIDAGRPFIRIDNKRESIEPTSLVFSEKFIQNTKVNGLSTFTDSNVYQLSVKRTPIRKLQPAGEVVLSIHERDTSSLYVGQRFVQTGSNQDILTQTLETIGDDRLLNGGHGTIHPQSVVEDNGRVWYFSAYTGELLRYNNGITPLAMVYKMRSYFKQKADQLLATGGQVVSGFDPHLNILYVTFEISGERETIGFVDRPGYEGFISFYDFKPEAYAKCQNKMFSFKDGQLWEHNANSTRNNFYGEQFSSSISFVMNAEFNKNKILRTLAEESNDLWTVPACTTPGGQETKLHKETWFVLKNGTYIAKDGWLRDMNTNPALLIGNQIPIRHGHEMEGKYFDVTIENDSTDEVRIDAVTNGYRISGGQRTV